MTYGDSVSVSGALANPTHVKTRIRFEAGQQIRRDLSRHQRNRFSVHLVAAPLGVVVHGHLHVPVSELLRDVPDLYARRESLAREGVAQVPSRLLRA